MVKGDRKMVPKASEQATPSPWSPFRHHVFAVLWTATVVSNIGTWMYNAGSGWLMTNLNADPLIIAMVQVAGSLPVFLLALPAGALADIVDRRRLLVVGESATTILSAIFAALVWLRLVTPGTLLLFASLIAVGTALTSPAWQAIVPQLVPSSDLLPAVTVNSVGFNISRAIGPALGGLAIAALGLAAPFWINAASNLATVGALLWWRSAVKPAGDLPAERFLSAMSTAFRHTRHNRQLGATVLRAVGFFVFASAYWALLPLVARQQISGGPELYGALLGAIGAGAVGTAFVLPWLRRKLGPDRIVGAGTIGTAAILVLYGLSHEPIMALTASIFAGSFWIAVIASLNVSAQMSLPDWVRGRGLAMFAAVMYGALTVGSLIWGQVAKMVGLPAAQIIAAGGALLVIPLTWRWKLQTGAAIDLTPSMHWPTPVVAGPLENDRGPVLVTVEYRLAAGQDRGRFVSLLERLGHERGRDGAYAWGLFEDTAEPRRFLETFLLESWLEHLRQHSRVTRTDRLLQDHITQLLDAAPTVRHLLTAEPDRDQSASDPPGSH
ncbi:MAG TPA: MFS transporter [Steroidobacteraceae bacterium]|jgi:MFS family permease|nr:MFS transporter [Steroidobacteraceae bacterium]